jgi:hypothetical protein
MGGSKPSRGEMSVYPTRVLVYLLVSPLCYIYNPHATGLMVDTATMITSDNSAKDPTNTHIPPADLSQKKTPVTTHILSVELVPKKHPTPKGRTYPTPNPLPTEEPQ